MAWLAEALVIERARNMLSKVPSLLEVRRSCFLLYTAHGTRVLAKVVGIIGTYFHFAWHVGVVGVLWRLATFRSDMTWDFQREEYKTESGFLQRRITDEGKKLFD
jgi:hypothetical protein